MCQTLSGPIYKAGGLFLKSNSIVIIQFIFTERMRQKAMQFALVGAIEERDVEKVQQLISDGVNLDAEIIFTKTPLTHAIELQHDKVALQLLENGSDPNRPVDEFPFSQPIHLAARHNLSNIIEKLVEMNVEPNVRDRDNMAPLHIASYFGRLSSVETLVRYGAEINLGDGCNRTPLHRAVETGSIDIVKTLIKHHVDIDATDIKGWTPLHLSIALDFQDIFRLLLENKCRFDIADVNGRTPLAIACDYLNRSNVDIVRATQFHYEGRTIDFLQGRYLSFLQRPKEEREMLQTVSTLINVGANVDGTGLLPISIAAKADHADTVCMLINAGALIPQFWQPIGTEIQLGFRIFQLTEWIDSKYILQYNLLYQCKRMIRKLLSRTCDSLENGIDKLPLPTSLKTFLK